jgi:hypothetical protein
MEADRRALYAFAAGGAADLAAADAAALVTSIRSNDELMAGNYWGWPRTSPCWRTTAKR